MVRKVRQDSNGYTEIGRKRLGRIITASKQIQRISVRDIETITRNLFNHTVNKGTVSTLENGNTRNPDDRTLNYLSVCLFHLRYFQVSEDDPIGVPILALRGEYLDSEKLDLLFANNFKELPHAQYRYTGAKELIKILRNEAPVKTLIYR